MTANAYIALSKIRQWHNQKTRLQEDKNTGGRGKVLFCSACLPACLPAAATTATLLLCECACNLLMLRCVYVLLCFVITCIYSCFICMGLAIVPVCASPIYRHCVGHRHYWNRVAIQLSLRVPVVPTNVTGIAERSGNIQPALYTVGTLEATSTNVYIPSSKTRHCITQDSITARQEHGGNGKRSCPSLLYLSAAAVTVLSLYDCVRD